MESHIIAKAIQMSPANIEYRQKYQIVRECVPEFEKLSLHNPTIRACLDSYLSGSINLFTCLDACIKALAEQNQKLLDEAIQHELTKPVRVVIPKEK